MMQSKISSRRGFFEITFGKGSIPLIFNRVDNAIKNLLHRRGRFLREHPHLIFSTTAMKLTPQRFSAQCKNTLIIAFLSVFHRSEQDLLGTLIQSYVLGHNPVVPMYSALI